MFKAHGQRIWRRSVVLGVTTLLMGLAGLLVSGDSALAYDRWSINGNNATNCSFCHGDFRASSYTGSDGQSWGNLHNIHRQTIVSGDCDVCHVASGRFPVFTAESAGGAGLSPIGCVGCHGRAEDGVSAGTLGYGLVLKQRHHLLDVGTDQNGEACIDCYAEADASVRTPVGEHVLPPYYANPGTGHSLIPTDPCNPPPDLVEDFAGATIGLDNDGDLLYDQNDPDCQPSAGSPPETSGPGLPQLLVAALSGNTLSISFGIGCETTDNTIEYGSLDQVGAGPGYSGQTCTIGTGPNYDWNLLVDMPDSMFFLVVANNGVNDGSYGESTPPGPRLPISAGTCVLPQSPDDRCDSP